MASGQQQHLDTRERQRAAGRGSEVVYDREQDRELALRAGRRWEPEAEEEEDGMEGYHCQICGYHAEQLQPFNVHLHTAHPAVVLQELYGLLGLSGSPEPGLLGAPLPGLGLTLGPHPVCAGGPTPDSGIAGVRDPERMGEPDTGLGSILGLTAGPHPVLGGGPVTSLGLTTWPCPILEGGPIAGLGLTARPYPILEGGPVTGLGLTTGPRPILEGGPIMGLGLSAGPHPLLEGGPIVGLGLSAGPRPILEGGPIASLGLSAGTRRVFEGGPIAGLGLSTGLRPDLEGGSIPGLSLSAGPRPLLEGGPIPGLSLSAGPRPVLEGGPIPGLSLSAGPRPILEGGPIPGLSMSAGPRPVLEGGPIPGLGLSAGPRPVLEGGPIPGLGLSAGPRPVLEGGPIPGLGLTGSPHPSPYGGPTPSLGLTPGPVPEPMRWEAVEPVPVQIDLTGEDDPPPGQLETGPIPSEDPECSPSAPDPLGPELEAGGPLAESFIRFPYPSPAELSRCGLSTGLPAERVSVWFAVQRLRHGISWTPEEVREARDRLQPPATSHRDTPGCRQASSSRRPCRDRTETGSIRAQAAGIGRWFSDRRGWRCRGNMGDGGGGREDEGSQDLPEPTGPRTRAPVLGRPRKSKEQLSVLKGFFLRCRWPGSQDYSRLVQITGLARADIIQWFGDTRYALKNGQLKWVHRGSAALAGEGLGTEVGEG
ncbi:uncharacterized protein [Narcine bancroftii]|uniref:uncharacterized protein n=1 Tax=Narcine bancroftii TaxID=1343680 RepID=UPI00383216F4